MTTDIRGEILDTMIPTRITGRTARPLPQATAKPRAHDDSWQLFELAGGLRFVPTSDLCASAGYAAGWDDARIQRAIAFGLASGHILPDDE